MKYLFSQDVKIALRLAREEAIGLTHDYIAPQHILLAFLHMPGADGELPKPKKPGRLREALRHSLGPGRGKPTGPELAYTALAKRCLEHAMADARGETRRRAARGAAPSRGAHEEIHLRNLLVGVLRADSAMAEMMSEFGLTLELLKGSAATGRGPAEKNQPNAAQDAVWYLQVDARSETPIYEQIMQRIEEAVATGLLVVGERLPAVRELASELEVAPGTVARAYAALEERGVVVTEGARGTRVAERTVTRGRDAERELALEALLKPIVVAAFHMGAKAQELRDALERAMKGILNGDTRSA